MPDDEVKEATPLARWMSRFRVSNREFGVRAQIAENYVGAIRTGARRPGDALKVAIEKATRAMERDLGIAEPVGVVIADWFSEAAIAELAAARRAGGV